MEMSFGIWTLGDPRNHILDGGSGPHTRKGNYEGEKGRPIILYMDSLPCAAVQKRLYRSRCCLGCGVGCMGLGNHGVHTGATL